MEPQVGYMGPFKNPINRIQKLSKSRRANVTWFLSYKESRTEKLVCELFKRRGLGGRWEELGCVMEVIVGKVRKSRSGI